MNASKVTICGQVTVYGQKFRAASLAFRLQRRIRERRRDGLYSACFSMLANGDIPGVPTWTPSPNISTSPSIINTMVATDNKGTNQKKAPTLPRNIAPEEARRTRIITTFKKQAQCQRPTQVQKAAGVFAPSPSERQVTSKRNWHAAGLVRLVGSARPFAPSRVLTKISSTHAHFGPIIHPSAHPGSCRTRSEFRSGRNRHLRLTEPRRPETGDGTESLKCLEPSGSKRRAACDHPRHLRGNGQ